MSPPAPPPPCNIPYPRGPIASAYWYILFKNSQNYKSKKRILHWFRAKLRRKAFLAWVIICNYVIFAEFITNPPYVPSIYLSLPFSGDVYSSNCSQHLFVRSTSRGEGARGVSKPVLRPAQNSFSVRLDILQEIGVKISFTSFSGQTSI